MSLRLAFEPVTQEFILDLESEFFPPATLQLEAIVFNYYHNAALIRFLMTSSGIDIVLMPVSDPTLMPTLLPSGHQQWTFRLVNGA